VFILYPSLMRTAHVRCIRRWSAENAPTGWNPIVDCGAELII
jgi:hypothetical protein